MPFDMLGWAARLHLGAAGAASAFVPWGVRLKEVGRVKGGRGVLRGGVRGGVRGVLGGC